MFQKLVIHSFTKWSLIAIYLSQKEIIRALKQIDNISLKVYQRFIYFKMSRIAMIKKLVELGKSESQNFQILYPEEILQQNPNETVTINTIIYGPIQGPYEQFGFLLQCKLSKEFPYIPPQVKFIDKPWNPFVCFNTGKVCCDVLHDQWSPALMTLHSIFITVRSLLSIQKMPEEEPGLNIEATAQMMYEKEKFLKKAYQIAQKNHFCRKELKKQESKYKMAINSEMEESQNIKKQFLNDIKLKKKLEEKRTIFQAGYNYNQFNIQDYDVQQQYE